MWETICNGCQEVSLAKEDAFHLIDSTYYNTHRRSRDKLKKRVNGGDSSRSQPQNAPKFAVKSEFRNIEESPHDTSATSSTLDVSLNEYDPVSHDD